jgi:hypothetical protein
MLVVLIMLISMQFAVKKEWRQVNASLDLKGT